MPLRRLATPLVLLFVLLGTAACTDDPEPRFADPTDDPTSSSSAPTSDPTTSSPPEKESIAEFLRRWQATGDEMQRTGESRDYRSLNSPGCASCNAFVTNVEEIYEAGGTIDFAGSTIVEVAKVSRADISATYDLRLKSGATRFRRTSESPLERLPPTQEEIRVTLVKRDARWIVSSYSRLPT